MRFSMEKNTLGHHWTMQRALEFDLLFGQHLENTITHAIWKRTFCACARMHSRDFWYCFDLKTNIIGRYFHQNLHCCTAPRSMRFYMSVCKSSQLAKFDTIINECSVIFWIACTSIVNLLIFSSNQPSLTWKSA